MLFAKLLIIGILPVSDIKLTLLYCTLTFLDFFDGSVGEKIIFQKNFYTAHPDIYTPKYFVPHFLVGQSILVNSLEPIA